MIELFGSFDLTRDCTYFEMSVVSLLGVRVVNNPAPFTAPYEFEITFECLEQLQKGVIDKPSGEKYFDLFEFCSNRLISRSGVETDLRRFCDFVSLTLRTAIVGEHASLTD